MESILIKNGTLVNEGKQFQADIFIKDGIINTIGTHLNFIADHKIDANGLLVLAGAIDDQVHFRQPGLTHKAEISTESAAAVMGGITSFMEMPNTKPQTLTQELLAEKYEMGRLHSLANYSFYMGASNDNIEEVKKTDPNTVCGVKVFMGSSTGNMLVDNEQVLEKIFSEIDMLIATHCEDEETIRNNLTEFDQQYPEGIPIKYHPIIRSEEACYLSSSKAVSLAKKHDTRLHILHISTAKELALFEAKPLEEKRITSEACIHHLWFTEEDYDQKGTRIKWNPAVKKRTDRDAIRAAVNDGRIDVIATDHAPHTIAEKNNTYLKAPSGGPLVQHAVPAMMDMVKQGIFSLELMVEKMCHAPARMFQIDRRGYLREGYFADIILVDPSLSWTVSQKNIAYKCGWSPFEGHEFSSMVVSTLVNGELVWHSGKLNTNLRGARLSFNR